MTAMTTDEARAVLIHLAYDLRWTWIEPMRRPFTMLNPTAWTASNENPLAVLRQTSDDYLAQRLAEHGFRTVLGKAVAARERDDARDRWFDRARHRGEKNMLVAYICSEFAIHECMQQYSGGLGVLAGDHLKSSADLGIPLIGFGLLYRQGYYQQEFRRDGSTRVVEPRWLFEDLPVSDTGVRVAVPIGRSTVDARVMHIAVGHCDLYLLDCDLKCNRMRDRELTRGLYRGDPDLRLRQQALLGIGAVHAADALGHSPTVWHLNEGHAAFCGLERIAREVEGGVPIDVAQRRVAAGTVFTTHTPVPAGHDRYDLGRCAEVVRPTLRRAGMRKRDLARLGQEGGANGPLCMTVLALRLSDHVNGVAALHGEISREMWKDVYECSADDVPIGHVTNGVHPGTWMPPLAAGFWQREIGLRPTRSVPRCATWKRAEGADPKAFWAMRATLRRRLIHVARERLASQARRRGEGGADVEAARGALREDALTIGFARRFATYKRAPLLFRDLDRLEALLQNDDRPVQILYAGKAHPLDAPGQALAQRIHDMTRRPAMRGKVVLLEEYDMGLGRVLTSGCDVWLNTPIRPHEASGTSGMKGPLSGGLNLSISDGWWPEADDGRNGWTIDGHSERCSDRERDRRDADALYRLLEDTVIPAFHTRNRHGLPMKWIRRALRAVATINEQFSSHRMVAEYLDQQYRPANRG
ncbi:MAG: alpha-glucan family phosphorylase [Phycisphaerales bacterium]|jgi:starch phosphorylase|nr:alpha-glucan family phosphorylase [Phycisphaerales bacterium]